MLQVRCLNLQKALYSSDVVKRQPFGLSAPDEFVGVTVDDAGSGDDITAIRQQVDPLPFSSSHLQPGWKLVVDVVAATGLDDMTFG